MVVSIVCLYLVTVAICLVIVGRTIVFNAASLALSLAAGFPVQDALCVRPFPHQRCHPGEWNSGGDQELPGREVHPPCPHEAR